jgi:methionine biosynthesis protein MetW
MGLVSRELEDGIICDWIEPGAAVLDLGCGEGDLLYRLVEQKNVRAQGIEIDEKKIYVCVSKELSVLQEDIDECLPDYKDKSFDYVVLQQTLTEIVKKPDFVIHQALRVGKKVIISFGNFVHYSARWQLLFRGKTPVTAALPYAWYDTPNLHFLSIADFIGYCRLAKITLERSAFIGRRNRVTLFPNIFSHIGLFLISL